MDNIILEIGLALALIAFAVALAHKLGPSNVPFHIGMAVGPHAPQPGVFDFRFSETNSLIAYMVRIGVLFLLFYLGLESNVSRLIEAGRSILTGGTSYVGINFTVGFTFGYLAGFPLREALLSLVGVIIAGLIVGKRAKLSTVGSLNTGFTLLARGEFPSSSSTLPSPAA